MITRGMITRGLRARLLNDVRKLPGASEFRMTEDVHGGYIELEISGGGARISRRYPVKECGYRSLRDLRAGISEFLGSEKELTPSYL